MGKREQEIKNVLLSIRDSHPDIYNRACFVGKKADADKSALEQKHSALVERVKAHNDNIILEIINSSCAPVPKTYLERYLINLDTPEGGKCSES